MKCTDEEIRAAYAETGNVWKAGDRLGIAGQTVHKKLRRLGVEMKHRPLSEAEQEQIRDCYVKGIIVGDGKLDVLAKQIGRTKQFICRYAGSQGLTRASRSCTAEVGQRIGLATKERIKAKGHPRGALGMKQTDATKMAQSWRSRSWWAAMNPEQRSVMTRKQLMTRLARHGTLAPMRHKVSWKQGWREIGGKRIYFRSRWEFNYAVYLEFLKERGQILRWEHEPETFWFDAILRGCVSYLPDFRVTIGDGNVEYHEVKGWMDARSRTKIKRMAKYHPHVKLRVIDGKWFKSNGPKLSFLKGWEK